MELRPDGLRHTPSHDLKDGDLFIIQHKEAVLLCLKGHSDRMSVVVILGTLHGNPPYESPIVLESRAINFLDAWVIPSGMIEPVHEGGLRAPTPTFTPAHATLAYSPLGGAGLCMGLDGAGERFELIDVATGKGDLLPPDTRFYSHWMVTVPFRDDKRRIMFSYPPR